MKNKPSGDNPSQPKPPRIYKGSNTDLISVDSDNNQSKTPLPTKKREIKAKDKQKEQFTQPFDEKKSEDNTEALWKLCENYSKDTSPTKSFKEIEDFIKNDNFIKNNKMDFRYKATNPLYKAIELFNVKLFQLMYNCWGKFKTTQGKILGYSFCSIIANHYNIMHLLLIKAVKEETTQQDMESCKKIIDFIIAEESAATYTTLRYIPYSFNSKACVAYTPFEWLIKESVQGSSPEKKKKCKRSMELLEYVIAKHLKIMEVNTNKRLDTKHTIRELIEILKNQYPSFNKLLKEEFSNNQTNEERLTTKQAELVSVEMDSSKIVKDFQSIYKTSITMKHLEMMRGRSQTFDQDRIEIMEYLITAEIQDLLAKLKADYTIEISQLLGLFYNTGYNILVALKKLLGEEVLGNTEIQTKLTTLQNNYGGKAISNILTTLSSAGVKAPKTLIDVVTYLNDQETQDKLKTLKNTYGGKAISNILTMLFQTGSKAPETLINVVTYLHKQEIQTKLTTLKKSCELDLAILTKLVRGSGSKVFEVLSEIVDDFYNGETQTKLTELKQEKYNVKLSSIIGMVGYVSQDGKGTRKLILDYLTQPDTLETIATLKNLEINFSTLCSLCAGARYDTLKVLKELFHIDMLGYNDGHQSQFLKDIISLDLPFASIISPFRSEGARGPAALKNLIPILTKHSAALHLSDILPPLNI